MFAPLDEAARRKRPAEDGQAKAEDEEGDIQTAKLGKALARLVLQHEDTLCSSSRDDNFAMAMKSEVQLNQALLNGADIYNEAGKKERKDKGDDYRGHPMGKKPNAFMKMVLFRLAEVMTANKDKILEASAQGPEPQDTQKAIKLLLDQGAVACEKEFKMTATRCFFIKTEDGAGKELTKWIFALNHPNHIDLKMAFNLIRNNGCLVAIGISLEADTGPRSKAAKEVQKLAFGRGAGSSRAKKVKQ